MEQFFRDIEFVRSVLDTMSDGLMVVDKRGTILYFNHAAEQITGFGIDEVLGRHCTMLNTDPCVFPTDGSAEKSCRLSEKGCVTRKKCTVRRKDGGVIHLLKNAMVLKEREGLTGAIGDSQCGGFFPAEMRAAGTDAIVFTAQSPEPVYLWLNDGRAELRPAKHLWGKVTGEVDRLLRGEVGDLKAEVAQIGPAGENMVRFAAIINMANRANGRTGMGAVMGSKRLEAVVVRGTRVPKPARPEAFTALLKQMKPLQEANPGIVWFGEYGTAGVLAIQNKMGGQPTRNYSEGTFEQAGSIDRTTQSQPSNKKA